MKIQMNKTQEGRILFAYNSGSQSVRATFPSDISENEMFGFMGIAINHFGGRTAMAEAYMKAFKAWGVLSFEI